MTNKLKGTLVGIVFSLIAVVVWVVLGVALEMIAGVAGGLMGVLFVLGYYKYNSEDKSRYVYYVASILIVIEIIISEIVTMAFLALKYDLPVGEVLSDTDVINGMFIDIAIGLVLSFLCFVAYIGSARRKDKLTNVRVNSKTSTKKEENVIENSDEKQ